MNDIFEKLGGRKMALTIFIIVVGGLVDVLSTNGLSANLAGLLVGATAVFGAANAAVTMGTTRAMGATATAAINAGQSVGDVASAASDVAVVDRHEELTTAVDNIARDAGLRLESQQAALESFAARLESQEKSMETATKLIKAMLTIKNQQDSNG